MGSRRFPSLAAVFVNGFENERIDRVHLLDGLNEGLTHRVTPARVHRRGQQARP
jgi:hypothetical protein